VAGAVVRTTSILSLILCVAAPPTELNMRHKNGFTLIELSIVLVIIGLMVGGVLVGRDLIMAASVRAQISQIEKINQAAYAFRGQYGYLPGDIPEPNASQFGFAARGTTAGTGDGNGIIHGGYGTGGNGGLILNGEAGFFWSDMTYANGKNLGLIEGTFSTARMDAGAGVSVPSSQVFRFLPAAKIGGGNYVYISLPSFCCAYAETGGNYIGVGKVVGSDSGGNGLVAAGMSVQMAHKIDSKMDDGYPQTGNVQTMFAALNCTLCHITGATFGDGRGVQVVSGTGATPASATTCFDNGNVAGVTQQYSLTYDNGVGMNCALSFNLK
jgi:prepilin-type N-terminal cleavage/methylation domain-containing protein